MNNRSPGLLPALAIATAIAGAASQATAQPTGGCCMPPLPPALTTQPCVRMDSINCSALGGTYLGDETDCTSPNYAAPSGCASVQYSMGQNGAPNGGQLNISGATLFADFF